MPSNKNTGTKMSLGAFVGSSPANEMAALPTGPRERGPDDDGSFRRNASRREDQDSYQSSRGNADNNWRHGGRGDGGRGHDDRRGGGFDDHGRSDSDNNWRRGGGAAGDFDDRGRGDTDNNWRRGGGGGGYSDSGRGGGSYNDRRSGGYNDRGIERQGGSGGGFDDKSGMNRKGVGFDDRGSRRGPGNFDNSNRDSGRFDRRGREDNRGFERSSDPPIHDSNSGGSRPRLQLKARTTPAQQDASKTRVQSNKATPHSETEASVSKSTAEEELPDTKGKTDGINGKESVEEKKRREPEVVNTRAAAMGAAPAVKRDTNNSNRRDRDRQDRNAGPPPVMNTRFEKLADDERENRRDHEMKRGPPPVANSRFAAAAEADRSNRDDFAKRDDRGPPPVANSRFAAAAEADRNYNRDPGDFDERGQPPVANSRFAAFAEADKDSRRESHDRGPPPVANSRFAAAAEADRGNRRDDYGGKQDDRGPPPVTNSRFAAAAAMAEQDGGYREDRGSRYNRNDGTRGSPLPQHSRFAATADPDNLERSDRNRNDRDRDGFDSRGEFGGRDGHDRRGRGDYDANRKFGRDSYDELPKGPAASQEPKSSVADLLKPKARPMEENILKVPTREQADNFLKVPTKADVLKPPGEKKSVPPKTKENSVSIAPSATTLTVDNEAILGEFINGGKQGDDLKIWLNGLPSLPPVETIVFRLLTDKEKLNPDVECAWAEPDKYGTGLLSLVQDDLLKQVEVLFGIQKYCDKLGMPKLDDEYVIQAMFRSMYKYDLAGDEAFMLWKDDESPEHEAGKLNAVIQTVDWFNWLEEDDEDDYEE